MTGVFDLARVIDGVDAWDMTSVRRSISEIRPDWVVNCIGVIKQLEEARDAKVSIYVNALFPHLLGRCSRDAGVRMIHLSTDCVFSGKKGDYVEEDPSDAEASFRHAVAIARHQQAKALELRVTMSQARLWQRQGRRDEARDALAAVYGTYTEGFTTPDLVDAAAQLDHLA